MGILHSGLSTFIFLWSFVLIVFGYNAILGNYDIWELYVFVGDGKSLSILVPASMQYVLPEVEYNESRSIGRLLISELFVGGDLFVTISLFVYI